MTTGSYQQIIYKEYEVVSDGYGIVAQALRGCFGKDCLKYDEHRQLYALILHDMPGMQEAIDDVIANVPLYVAATQFRDAARHNPEIVANACYEMIRQFAKMQFDSSNPLLRYMGIKDKK